VDSCDAKGKVRFSNISLDSSYSHKNSDGTYYAVPNKEWYGSEVEI
jgi:hypothetical protein